MEDDPKPIPPDPQSSFHKLWSELKRRHVVRVAITYAVVGWAIMQVAGLTFEGFDIPIWAFRFVMLMVILGFPLALILAWAFELTPEGIKTSKTALAEQGDVPLSKTQQQKRHWFSLGLAAAVPTLIFGVLALFFFIRLGSLETELASTELAKIENDKSIAVLPLENMSPDPENAFFADGVQEDILTNLARIEDLHVIARTSTQQYRDTTKTVDVIGRELGISYLVEGSVRRAGNRVKVTVQLVECASGNHIWADDYNKSLDDIFAIQAEVAKEIAGQLHAALSPEEIERIEYRPTESQEAYDYWLRHRKLLEIRSAGSRSGWQEKIETLEKVVRFDPEFAEAWAQLSIERIIQWRNVMPENSELLSSAHFALKQASKYGSDLAYIRYAQSFFAREQDLDLGETIRLLLESLEIDPSLRGAQRQLGKRYLRAGRIIEARKHLQDVYRTDPLSPRSNYELLAVYISEKDWFEATKLVKTYLKYYPDSTVWNNRLLQLDFLKNGGKDKYVYTIESVPENSQDPISKVRLALVKGNLKQALIELAELDLEYYHKFVDTDISKLWIWPRTLLEALVHEQLGESVISQQKSLEAKHQINQSIQWDPLPKASSVDFSIGAISEALNGNSEAMNALIRKARDRSSNPNLAFQYQVLSEMHIAIAYIVLGEHDKALSTLEAASKMDSPIFLNRELDLWFIFDRLRGNPRFDALLK